MNKKKFLILKKDCIEKRNALAKFTQEELIKTGDFFFDENLYYSALDFYAKANNQEGLLKLKEVAINTGDAFLLLSIKKESNKESNIEILDSDWQELAKKAESLNKNNYAKIAYDIYDILKKENK